MPADRMRARWSAGEVAVNAWLTLEGEGVAAAVARAEPDAVTIDLQHGWTTDASVPAMVAAIETAGCVPMARLAWNEPAGVMRALDLGVRGVIAPMVASGAEARSLVSASRYPPIGARSYGAIRSPFGLGREQVEDAERNVLVFAMIETREGLDHVDEIAATRGLDGVYVGPADLSLAIGSPSFADLEEPSMLEALDAIVAAAERHGIVAGIHAPSPAASVAMAERGFRLVSPVVDEATLSRAAAADVSETRARLRRA